MSEKTEQIRSRVTTNRRRARADVLLRLAELLMKPRHLRGPTVTQLMRAISYSRASVYRFLAEIRRLGLEPHRELVNGEMHYSLPPGSVHQLAIYLVRSLVRRSAGERLHSRFSEALANGVTTTLGGRR